MTESTDFKKRAAAAEEELATVRPEVDSSDDEAQPTTTSQQITALDRDESSSKIVLNAEMDRYLSLQTSMALPMPPGAAQAAFLYQLPQRESKFNDAFSAATEGFRCVNDLARSHTNKSCTSSKHLNIPNYVKDMTARSRHRFS